MTGPGGAGLCRLGTQEGKSGKRSIYHRPQNARTGMDT